MRNEPRLFVFTFLCGRIIKNEPRLFIFTILFGAPFNLIYRTLFCVECNLLFNIICVIGDGAFELSAMEMDTAIRHNIPIVVIIGNDQCWGMVSPVCPLAFPAQQHPTAPYPHFTKRDSCTS